MEELASYEVFFGLRDQPFGRQPLEQQDSATDWLRPGLAGCARDLGSALRRREGLVLLLGPAGTGKEVLVRHVLNHIRWKNGAACALLDAGKAVSNSIQRDQNSLTGLGIMILARAPWRQIATTARTLVGSWQTCGFPVLAILRAEQLDDAQFEALAFLNNLRLPILLAGRPSLAQVLAKPEMAAVQSTLSYCATVPSLSVADVAAYADHRLAVAGKNAACLFEAGAIEAVAAHVDSLHQVDRLCHLSLQIAATRKARRVSVEMVETAAKDAVDQPMPDPVRSAWSAVRSAGTQDLANKRLREQAQPLPGRRPPRPYRTAPPRLPQQAVEHGAVSPEGWFRASCVAASGLVSGLVKAGLLASLFFSGIFAGQHMDQRAGDPPVPSGFTPVRDTSGPMLATPSITPSEWPPRSAVVPALDLETPPAASVSAVLEEPPIAKLPAGKPPVDEPPTAKAPSEHDMPVVAAAEGNLPTVALPQPSEAPVRQLLDMEDEQLLLRGDRLLAQGDLAGARLFYERAVLKADNGHAATGLGKTFDPVFYQEKGVFGAAADWQRASDWYRKAVVSGDVEASKRLTTLERWLASEGIKAKPP
jgi:type II secretory pathway predicted ATPase ExeA